MKTLLLYASVAMLAVSCTVAKTSSAQQPKYTVIADDKKEKVLKGYIDKSVLDSDTAFRWFRENMRYGSADAVAVEAFKKYGNDFKLLIFGGTWCEDTQAMLPLVYRLAEKSGYPETNITLVAVDRSKIGPDDLHQIHNVTNVPTFIVLRDGKEIGRVVEFGKYAQVDKELGEIVMKAFSGN